MGRVTNLAVSNALVTIDLSPYKRFHLNGHQLFPIRGLSNTPIVHRFTFMDVLYKFPRLNGIQCIFLSILPRWDNAIACGYDTITVWVLLRQKQPGFQWCGINEKWSTQPGEILIQVLTEIRAERCINSVHSTTRVCIITTYLQFHWVQTELISETNGQKMIKKKYFDATQKRARMKAKHGPRHRTVLPVLVASRPVRTSNASRAFRPTRRETWRNVYDHLLSL